MPAGTSPRYFASSFCVELMLPRKADLVIIEQVSVLPVASRDIEHMLLRLRKHFG